MRICIYASSTTAFFFRGLIDACKRAGDDVEWSVITPQGHFRYLFAEGIPPERRCYLYADFATRYRNAGEAEIQRGLEADEGLIVALMKDKDGYRHLEKQDQLRRAAAMHGCYEAFLQRVRPDFVLFPDLEATDGFVLMNLCRSLGIGVLYSVGLRFLGRSFFAPDPYETLPAYFDGHTDEDLAAARVFLAAFRARRTQNAGDGYRSAPPPKPSLFRRLVVSAWLQLRTERLHATEETLRIRISRNLLGPVTRFRRWRFDFQAARYFDRLDPDALPAKHLYYALHYTPESSVNGLEPYYVDQLRAIDALLLNLPKGYRLVVKEHPAMYGVRPIAFYRALRRRPGLILLLPTVDSRKLIERAAITVTVTGTVGLEAYLLDRPCLSFGRNFFAHLCWRAPALSELRATLEDMIASYRPPSEAEKEIEVARLLNIGADFLVSDPWYSPTVMAPENIAAARSYLWRHLDRLKKVPA